MDSICIDVHKRQNWLGEKYFIFETKQHGKIAEIDIYPDKFRVFGYDTWNCKAERKTKKAAFNLAKKEIKTFLGRIGFHGEINYLNMNF